MRGIKPIDSKPAATNPRRHVWVFERSESLRDANVDYSGESNEASIVKRFIAARCEMLTFASDLDNTGTRR